VREMWIFKGMAQRTMVVLLKIIPYSIKTVRFGRRGIGPGRRPKYPPAR
jgi:hypothetical protein